MSTERTNQKFKYAAIQLHVTADKQKNLENAKSKIEEAANNGAKLVALPVIFCLSFFF